MKIEIKTDYIKLDQALKLCGVCGSGSDAKLLISEGKVSVCGAEEKRRGKKLYKDDSFTVFKEVYEIV